MSRSSTNCSARRWTERGSPPAVIAKEVGSTQGLVYNIKSTSGMTGKRAAVKRGPSRPRKIVAAASMDGFAGIVAAVQSGERERGKMRPALERIQGILTDVLS